MLTFFTRTRFRRAPTSILRPNTKSFYSTNRSAFNSKTYFAAATLIGASGIWWVNGTRKDVPRLDPTPVGHLAPEPGPSKDDVTQMISKDAYSFQVRDVTGINRYDGTQLASNSPCEDRFIHGKLSSPWSDGEWLSWGVFDGHAGWQTADLLTRQLLPLVRNRLSKIQRPLDGSKVADKAIQRAIINGFMDLDDSIIMTAQATSESKDSLQDKAKKLAPAYSGSCALLSLYDSNTGKLHVACTGDSRAVLGQKDSDGKWEVIPLSIDQTGYNEEEVARLYKEHPDEEDIVKNGRVLGIAVSRAFGDSRWKWPIDLQSDMKRKFNGPAPLTPRYDVRTPPYLTAEPVVTSTKIDPNKPSFLIMASDGLWDNISSKQSVDLVAKWLELGKKETSKLEPSYEQCDFGKFRKDLDWRFEEGRTTVEDENAAVHLVRNSLGGNYHELIAGRLAFGPPFSRRIRDDITVQVVFFNVEK
ncbi:Protein phosphatase 2C [Penicillium paradoxum]|uniref:Protein phosphatase 2C n=1 Tax=Penicillium paradoxum TaxID=176176 RepID=UPI0025468E4D|nr:Protein phosphatase 2C [Penicillium paradoxum]KAJ5793566.1 Protein phosphatase 2C [Penicillium paradoxum]